ncbi:hypothetical protein RUM44_010737 [Polyplax serrata]|uniref:Uncharacterized protein n=1 Tax=Polyplax serrata TaxID=468196 RepID=A0ABR1AN56_POLSC
MFRIRKKIIFLVVCQICLLTNAESDEGRDFGGHLGHGENHHDYQIAQYPPNYYPTGNDYADHYDSPLQSLLGRGLNLLMLKMGVVGFIKGVVLLFFFGFLIKLPFILLKVAVLKSLFLPFLVAPLLYQYYMSNMNQSDATTTSKPGENASKPNEGDLFSSGRYLDDDSLSVAWKSVKMFAENEQCLERIYCVLGATNNDSFTGNAFSRVLKFIQNTSPPVVSERMTLIAKAFNKGSRTASCPVDEYKCDAPEILLQQGLRKIKIL